MKIKKNLVIFVIIAVFMFGCSQEEDQKTQNIEPGGEPLVEVSKATKSTINATLTYSGKVKAEMAIDLAPELSMQVLSIDVAEGDWVKKGQTLATMDTTKLFQARIQYKDASKNFERMKALRKSEYVEEQKFEQVKTAYETAKLNYEYIKNNTIIKAPFAGYITDKTKKEGEYYIAMLPMATGNPSLFRLVNLNELKVEINISDKDISKIKAEQNANIKIEGIPDKIFGGKVTFVSAEADPYSGLFRCYVKIKHPGKIVKPNMFARVEIIIDSSSNATVIPQIALIDSQYVFLVKDNIVHKKKVKVGIMNNKNLELINDAVHPGDKVVIKGNVGLKNNSRVQIENK